MMVGDVQTPVTFESQLSIGVGAAIDTAYGTFIREFGGLVNDSFRKS